MSLNVVPAARGLFLCHPIGIVRGQARADAQPERVWPAQTSTSADVDALLKSGRRPGCGRAGPWAGSADQSL